MYRGFCPLWGAGIVAALSTFVTIFAVGGVNAKSLAAIVGTMFRVCMAGAAASLFGIAAGISGYNVSEIESLLYVTKHTTYK